MHTAICAFDTREQGEQAVATLERAGFARRDLHIEHRHSTSGHRSVFASYGRFLADLLGRTNPPDRADTYAQHVEHGRYVVVVDARDEAEAQRAESMLRDLQARDLNVVPRAGQRPLREMLAQRADTGETPSRDASLETERAMASQPHRVSATAGPGLRDPETEHPPGLRYADKDKPL